MQNAYAQETHQKTENNISTNLDFPIPKRIFDTEKGEYAAFTMEQYSQLIRIYNAYLTLGKIAVVQQEIILNLEFQVGQQYQKMLLMESLHELLSEKNRVLEKKNDKLASALKKEEKTTFLKILGVSALSGLAFGLVGMAVGKSI